MNKLLALVLLVLSFNVSAQELLPDSDPSLDPATTKAEEEWIDEFYIVKEESIRRGWYGNLALTRLPSEDGTPAATYFLGGGNNKACTYMLTVYNNAFNEKILSYFAPEDRSEGIRLIWAHELGHCAQFHSDKLDMFLFWPSFIRNIDNTVEAYADVFALAYAAQRFPEKYNVMVAFLLHLRITLNTHPESTEEFWIPAFQRYNTSEYVRKAEEIKKLAKKLKPEQVAAKIVYGIDLK